MPRSISAVINTFNEEANLPFALRSIRSWVDEIVVVDMCSNDATVDIAHEFGAKVFLHEQMGFADPARAFALEQASSDWILILDADEVIPLALSRKLLDIVRTDGADVVRIPRRNYLLGVPMMHSLWGPDQDTHVRFFKRGHLQTTSTVHDYLHPNPKSRVMKLRYQPGCAIVHFNYLDSSQFIERLNRYTSIEAEQEYGRGKVNSEFRALVRGAGQFAKRYVWGGGWRDGWRGLYLSLFMSFYRIATSAKVHELREFGDREVVCARYREQAEQILQEYSESLHPPVPDNSTP